MRSDNRNNTKAIYRSTGGFFTALSALLLLRLFMYIKDGAAAFEIAIIVFVILVFLGVGITMLVLAGRKPSTDLTVTGIAVEAMAVEYGPAGDGTYQIRAQYVDARGISRDVYAFGLDVDPTPYVIRNNGKVIVYIDPMDSTNYLINPVDIKVANNEAMRNFMGGNTPPMV